MAISIKDPRLFLYLIVVIIVAGVNIWVAYRADHASNNNPTWYKSLDKPEITYNTWLLTGIRILVYISLLVSGYLVILGIQDENDKRLIQNVLIIQLAIRLAWIIILYFTHNVLASYYLALLLFILNVGINMFFGRVNVLAAWLYLPYTLWTAYTLYLSHHILINNHHHSDSLNMTPFL